MDIGSIMYNYIWMGFVKLLFFSYRLGGIQFTIGFICGLLIMMFTRYLWKILAIFGILIVVGSIAIGIIASDITLDDIKSGQWVNKTDITQQQYQEIPSQIGQQVADYTQNQIIQQVNDTWASIG